MYHHKLLELVAIERHADKSFLHIRLTFSDSFEFYWEVDNKTAESLRNVVSFDGNGKLRLSLQHSYNSTEKSYRSVVTRTYLSQSEANYFYCSDNYINDLQSIRSMTKIEQLLALSTIHIEIPQTIEIQDVPIIKEELPFEKPAPQPEKPVQVKKSVKTIPNGRLSFWFKCAILAIVFVALFGFGYDSLMEQKEAESFETDHLIADEVAPVLEDVEIEEDKVDIEAPVLSDLPFIKLTETVTYNTPKGTVALTFDDGPSIYSKEIVDILTEYEAGGTFFYIGQNVKKYPDVVKYVHTNGYSIGSHSMRHATMPKLTYEQQKSEINQSKKIIEETIAEDVLLFRPPYGAKNNITVDLVKELDTRLVLWNKDPEDWKTHNPEKIIRYIKGSDASGSIILLHESQAVVEALPEILTYLQGQGLEIVNLY